MDVNISSLHFFNFEPVINTFKGPLPIEKHDNSTFYTVSNLFYVDGSYSSVIKEWVEHFKTRRHEFVLARGVCNPAYQKRSAFSTIYALFKIPVTADSMRTSCKRPAEIPTYSVHGLQKNFDY